MFIEGSNFTLSIGRSWLYGPRVFEICLAWNRREYFREEPVPENEIRYADRVCWYWSTKRFSGVRSDHYFMPWSGV